MWKTLLDKVEKSVKQNEKIKESGIEVFKKQDVAKYMFAEKTEQNL